MGYTAPKPIQYESMDQDLRNSLWNVWYQSPLSKNVELFFTFVEGFLKVDSYSLRNEINSKPYRSESLFLDTYRNEIFYKTDSKWYLIYDFLEFIVDKIVSIINDFPNHTFDDLLYELKDQLDYVLERENSAYRIVDYRFVPITNEQEIETIEEALEQNDPGVRNICMRRYNIWQAVNILITAILLRNLSRQSRVCADNSQTKIL